MENINLNANDSLCAIGKRIDVENVRKLSVVEKYIWNLMHAGQCNDSSCQLTNCRTMKRIIQHTNRCNKRASACSICKQVVSVCCYHARHCQKIECPVSFCANVKLRLVQKRPAHATSIRRKLAATSIQQMEFIREDRLCRLKENLRQLIEILKNPNTLEKQSQILYMLKSNPSLVNALVKLRQTLVDKQTASSQQSQRKRVQRRREWLRHQQRLLIERQQLELEDQRQPNESAIRQLINASQCNDSNCRLDKCRKMKRVVHHFKICQRRTTGGCSVCKQIVALCCNHVKHCLQDDCSVPFCLSIKRKLEARRCDAVIVEEKDELEHL